MSTVRLKRLQSDFEKLQGYVRGHPRLQIVQVDGTPPERYQIHLQVVGLRQKDEELLEVDSHLVEIVLPRDYPRVPPQCRMLTPVFHPNIAPHAICIGDHWSAGEPLASLVARIGEMITYQSYNTKSPLNGEAAKWTDQNIESLPLEAVSMAPDETSPVAAAGPASRAVGRSNAGLSTEAVARPAAKPAPAPAPAQSAVPATFPCSSCGARLRHSAELVGKRIRCPKCQTIAIVPALS